MASWSLNPRTLCPTPPLRDKDLHTTLPLMETLSPRQQSQFQLERRIPLSKNLLQMSGFSHCERKLLGALSTQLLRSMEQQIEKWVFYQYQKMKSAAAEAEKKDVTHERWKEISYHNLLIRGA
ncbi:hypothetical protein AAHA92_31125 [Salvia divinorum]|uniref:Uncharacterized protein n=1 Tax=Salvia divinorum TaxID=28513 RepID=A0ABD1FTN0_SALDI